MLLKDSRAAALKAAQGIVDGAKAASRDLTDAEQTTIEAKFAEIGDLDVKIAAVEKSASLVSRLTSIKEPGPDGPPLGASGPGPVWAKQVTAALTLKAGTFGLKSLLSGEITTPPAVEVAALPAVPARLLDLIPRQGLDEQTFSYLRQIVATNNAAPVADNALKPTSVYTFEEIEDRARVVAHLSEPFPIRYATDHTSMVQVLDSQMQGGIFEALERLIVSGTGVGEEWAGILTTTGTTAVPFAVDLPTTLRRARTILENKGERVSALAMNPSDIEALDLLREDGTTGGYLLDGAAYERIFGPGVKGVPSVAVPVGTAIVGDWSQTRLRVREDAATLAATQAGDLFDKNQMKLRSEGRFGFQFFRPQAMAVVALRAA